MSAFQASLLSHPVSVSHLVFSLKPILELPRRLISHRLPFQTSPWPYSQHPGALALLGLPQNINSDCPMTGVGPICLIFGVSIFCGAKPCIQKSTLKLLEQKPRGYVSTDPFTTLTQGPGRIVERTHGRGGILTGRMDFPEGVWTLEIIHRCGAGCFSIVARIWKGCYWHLLSVGRMLLILKYSRLPLL